MPIYDYQCQKCGHAFEVKQSFSDPPVGQCPACKAKKVERLIGKPAVHFKGSGFYVTDSKGGKSGGEAKKPKSAPAAEPAPCAAASSTGGGCGAGACAAD